MRGVGLDWEISRSAGVDDLAGIAFQAISFRQPGYKQLSQLGEVDDILFAFQTYTKSSFHLLAV